MSKNGRPQYVVQTEWLLKTAADIEQGVTTINSACQSVPVVQKRKGNFSTYIYKRLSRYTLIEVFERNGIKVDRKSGRLQKPIYEQVKQQIMNVCSETKMGSTKTYETIVARSVGNAILKTVSHRMVYNTMKQENLLKFSREPQTPKVTRCRYEANYADLIWHTDLHIFNGAYLIAFIDDYSRYIVYWEIITSKDAITTSNVLSKALADNNRPFSIWTDNGGEFKGEFYGVMIRNNIKKVLTDPYTPQQNGKCERFWATADNCADQEALKKWISTYNNMPHLGLPEIRVDGRKTHFSPAQRYTDAEHKWNPTITPTWTVDGISKPFKPKEI